MSTVRIRLAPPFLASQEMEREGAKMPYFTHYFIEFVLIIALARKSLRIVSAVQLEIVKEGWPRIWDTKIVHSLSISLDFRVIWLLGCVLGLTWHSLARAHVWVIVVFGTQFSSRMNSQINLNLIRLSVLRVFSGCLGVERRRKTWHSAISSGEARAPFDPEISEWGNPPSKPIISYD